jgi:hypothetical protein
LAPAVWREVVPVAIVFHGVAGGAALFWTWSAATNDADRNISIGGFHVR